jgi:hypothetical protein
MWQWGALAFANPWLLLGAVALPILWQIIRFTPPSPKRLSFPSLRLLKFLKQKNETPRRSPWWLLALRLSILVLVILAAARPILNPEENLLTRDNLLLVIDNNWAMAPHWHQAQRQMQQLLEIAARGGKTVQLLLTTPDPDSSFRFLSTRLSAEAAAQAINAIQPKPWPARFDLAKNALAEPGAVTNSDIVWFSAGIAEEGLNPLLDKLGDVGQLRIILDASDPLLMLYVKNIAGDRLQVNLRRNAVLGNPLLEKSYTVVALDARARALAQKTASFAQDDSSLTLDVELPTQLKNKVQRLVLREQTHAGTTYIFDERGRQYPVGIITAQAMDASKPFLDELYYIERAIAPFAEIHQGNIQQLLQANLAAIIMTDRNSPTAIEAEAIRQWVEAGGMLIRFAGEQLSKQDQGLSPVAIRPALRELGGNLSWTEAPGIGAIPEHSPFFGLSVPAEIKIKKQLLAENEAELASKTWLALDDGTPLITGRRLGQGQVVLFHIAAQDSWSNFMLSGLFVEALQRLIWLSRGVAPADAGSLLSLQEMLDGFGRLQAPPIYSKSISAEELATKRVSPAYPPGYYGAAHDRQAFNLADHIAPPAMITDLPAAIPVQASLQSAERDLRPYLYAAILLLALLDTLVRLNLGRFWQFWRRALPPVATVVLCLWAGQAWAGVMDNSQKVHLAYIRTGSTEIDRISTAGLRGLSQILLQRTAVDVADPVGIDIAQDELAFYPLLYWPFTPGGGPILSPQAAQRLGAYLQNGGLLVIDTRDGTGAAIAQNQLAQAFQNLYLPPLQPISADHVLLRSFYLLKSWPGRYADLTLWLAADTGNQFDGVASVIVGTQDWAGAWATDAAGKPLLPVSPGGEAQRETARRFGVNLVMYALTGNYKADQVHVPAILERLGNAP